MQIVGFQTRTTNTDEADPQTSRLGPLWNRVMQPGAFDGVANKVNDTRLVAVLFDYDSDETGAYTELVGVEVSAIDKDNLHTDMSTVAVPSAQCMTFVAKGEMPQAIVTAWQEVWTAFPINGYRRSFKFDVEIHPIQPGAAVDLLIAVEPV